MNTHDASWVLMMHHEYSWCIMRAPYTSWVLFKGYMMPHVGTPKLLITRHLLVPGKTGFSRGFWQDRSERENGAQLYGPRVSIFLSHGIVKSLTFRIYGKLKFQCTRNGPQNPPFCPGSIQNTFMNFPRYLTTRFPKNISQKQKTRKSENPGSLTSAQ